MQQYNVIVTKNGHWEAPKGLAIDHKKWKRHTCMKYTPKPRSLPLDVQMMRKSVRVFQSTQK